MKWSKVAAASALVVGALVLCLGNAVFATETVVYSQGFESGDGSFLVSNASGIVAGWVWGTPPSLGWGPGSAHGGSKCWGTFLNNQPLRRYADGSIVSPAITLPSISANQIIRVRFWAFVSIDGMYDRGQFFVSKDGANWESKIQLYNNMETSPSVTPTWKKYEISLDPGYAGGPVYLRFRAATPNSENFYCGGSDDLSGLFIDDLAITVYDTAGDKKAFTMTAYEDAGTWASCPWVAPWNGSELKVDNDIYSVARGAANEYTDFYKLMQPLVGKDGVYSLQVKEMTTEDSFTDLAALMEVDHAPDVTIAPDEKGGVHAYRPAALLAPQSAVDNAGNDVLAKIALADDVTYAAYSGTTVTTDFGDVDVSQGVILVLRVKGFVDGTGPDLPYIGPPAVVVETVDNNGQWQERGRLLPRFEFSVAAFDLSAYLSSGQPVRVRLSAISHGVKYQAIDFVALQAGAEPSFTANLVSSTVATSGAANILNTVATADGSYFKMGPGESCTLQFPILPLAMGQAREFLFVSKGYYVPQGGSFLVYTWDGANWVERDATSYPGSYAAKSFDLTLFLPDPDGEYKVRVWQDYQYEPAGIDCVAMTVGANAAALNWAWDYRSSSSIYSKVLSAGDGNVLTWSYCPRDRVTQFKFTPPLAQNTPPTTFPVVGNGSTRAISWTYNDADGDAQAQAEVQIWDGPGATGVNWWNPAVFSGTGASAIYPANLLPPGTYYARVKAYDGKDWGQWSEGQFVVQALPPVASATRALNSRNPGAPYYYQLTATDPSDPVSALRLYVSDSGSSFVAGPYSSGSIVQLKKGATAGVAAGTGLVKAVITVVGNAQGYAVNTSGRSSAMIVLSMP